jgi:ribose transport system ATP-binding protein
MTGITKRFPGVLALENAHLFVESGECLGLVGENGAGKSTLMKILSGAQAADSGTIQLDGKPKSVDSPITARRLGIAMIYQELNLLPELSVAENIFLGHEVMNGSLGWLDRRSMIEQSENLLASFGQHLSGQALVKHLGLAQQQVVEIAKALSIRSRILIMDEPSAILTGRELNELFELIRRLKQQGVAIIYISHRLEEIFEICDRVTIMRDGRTVHTGVPSRMSQDEIIRWVVGREVETVSPRQDAASGDEVLRLEGVCQPGKLHDIHLQLHRGEILGLTGLVGAGRTELARVIFGAGGPFQGKIYLEGEIVDLRSPRQAIDAGIGFLTEDRKGQGLVLNMEVGENITLANLGRLTRAGLVDTLAERRIGARFIEELRIKTPSADQKVRNLSGGNQQKVVLAKWLFTQSRVLIFDEPTRGIDVGSKAEIYHLMLRLAAQGLAILMISSELPEILKMCDRILVMHEGRISGELRRDEATQEKIMTLAMGLDQRVA